MANCRRGPNSFIKERVTVMKHACTVGVLWLARAMLLSLAAVTLFVVGLGLIFLPREAARLSRGNFVSINECLLLDDGRAASLFWDIPFHGTPGWHHQFAILDLNSSRLAIQVAWPELDPQCLARGPAIDQSLIGDLQGRIYLIDLERTDQPPRLIGRQSSGAVVGLACSADGQYVFSYGDDWLYGWHVASGERLWQVEMDVGDLTVAPDGRSLMCCTRIGELVELDCLTGATLRSIAQHHAIARAAISPDTGHLATLNAVGDVVVMHRGTFERVWQSERDLSWPPAGGRVVTYSPCGTLLITSAPHSAAELMVWNAATGQRRFELRGHRGAVLGAAFADGSLYSWGTDGTIRTWDLSTGASSGVRTLSSPARSA
jgi:WD40 repeat protein